MNELTADQNQLIKSNVFHFHSFQFVSRGGDMSRASFGAAHSHHDVAGQVRNGSAEETVKAIDNTVLNSIQFYLFIAIVKMAL
jgi:hypothetical protein